MQRFVLPAVLGSAIGGAQTMLLREYVDTPMANDFLNGKTTTKPLLVKQLQGFGTPSAVAGMVGGLIGLGLGLYAQKSGKILRTVDEQIAALTYGAGALTTGILSGIYPTQAMQNVIAKDPSNPVYALSSTRRGVLSVGSPAPATISSVPAPVTSNQAVLKNFQ